MNRMRIFYVLAMIFMCTHGDVAHAQTCADPTNWTPGNSGLPLADTTCGHEADIIAVCQDSFGAPGQAYVALVNITDEATFTQMDFTGGAGYTLAAYLIPQSNGCGNFACTTSGDDSVNMLHGDIPEGSYYLIITGADFDAAGACGTFSLVSDGPLPVTLREFLID